LTPAARLQAALDLSGETASTFLPADEAVGAFFRNRRYAGSKDRRWITERFYALLRRRARLDWWAARILQSPADPEQTNRLRLIADMALSDGMDGEAIGALFSGEKYAPASLNESERGLISGLADENLDHPDMPAWDASEYPEWLDADLRRTFGDGLAGEMAALNEPADVNLRINTLKVTRDEAIAILAKDGIEAEAVALSPLGLKLKGRANLRTAKAFRKGTVEVQDEGSQIIALLTGARPGMSVIDFCAGAGGKTLALAAIMENTGELAALDVSEARLQKMSPRLRRSGATNIGARALTGMDDDWLKLNKGAAERVLVDAPCSGSGAWRRNPDAKWKLTPETLESCLVQQKETLSAAAGLVAPGGRLVYATCSVLDRENRDQADWFLETHPGFTPKPIEGVWKETIGGDVPEGCLIGPYLRLTPKTCGTDGFFAAVFERKM